MSARIFTAIMLIAALVAIYAERRDIIAFFAPNLSGRWELTLTTEHSSFKKFARLRQTFLMDMEQSGLHLSGTGELRCDSGQADVEMGSLRFALADAEISPILNVPNGLVWKANLPFVARGKRRESSGVIHMSLVGKILHGRFRWTAADAVGDAVATQIDENGASYHCRT